MLRLMGDFMSTSKTIATWNVKRGHNSGEIGLMLNRHNVDIALLQECDVGMARSGNVHVPRCIASVMEADYVMAIEFEEEGLGNLEEREQFPRATNKNGLHCNAIIARDLPFISHHIELSAGREWKPDGDQPRYGGRQALAARVDGVYYVSVHLESRTSPSKRNGQFNRLLHALNKIGAERVVIGGDFNTKDPDDSLIFVDAAVKDYKWMDANQDTGRFAGHRLDWFFYRGVTVEGAYTVDASGLSDHDLMLLDILV